jgi:hypothetical protein
LITKSLEIIMWSVDSALKTVKVGPKLWMLLAPMKYTTPRGKFTVPKGYLTDHASVPRLFVRLVPPVQSAIAEASVLHDWFYNNDSPSVPRDFADKCLKELTIANGGTKALAYTAWTAVRCGGGGLYRKESYSVKIKRSCYDRYKRASVRRLRRIFIRY